jgi:hypothetical protein
MAGYIGSKASVVSSGAERKKVFDITATTTSLTGCSYTPNQVHVFHNGVRLVDGTDYTATDGSTVTLTTAAQSGDEVVVISYATFQPADAYTKTESDGRYVNVTGDTMTGNLSVNGTVNVTTVDFGDWTITESAGVLYFATGGVNKMKLDASGNLTVTGDVTAYGTV